MNQLINRYASNLLNIQINQRGVLVLLFLIAVDVTFIVGHFIHKATPYLPGLEFSIAEDRGYAEFFQYAKTLSLAGLLGLLAYRTRSLIYGVWSALFCLLFCDDAFSIHENLGVLISNALALNPMFYVRSQDLGEIIVFATYGIVILAALLLAHRFDHNQTTRRTSVGIIMFLLALGGFAVVVDMLHVQAGSFALPRIILGLLTIAEDGGEMVVVSLLLWFIYLVSAQRPDSQKSLK